MEVRLRPVQLEHYTAASSAACSSRQQQQSKQAASQRLFRRPCTQLVARLPTCTHAQPAWTDTLLYRKSQDPQAPPHTE
eukprot:COSAG01_NODE_3846_length_5644_cov_48.943192_10_plen_79_part_00